MFENEFSNKNENIMQYKIFKNISIKLTFPFQFNFSNFINKSLFDFQNKEMVKYIFGLENKHFCYLLLKFEIDNQTKLLTYILIHIQKMTNV